MTISALERTRKREKEQYKQQMTVSALERKRKKDK
jgi:hypothetical protein